MDYHITQFNGEESHNVLLITVGLLLCHISAYKVIIIYPGFLNYFISVVSFVRISWYDITVWREDLPFGFLEQIMLVLQLRFPLHPKLYYFSQLHCILELILYCLPSIHYTFWFHPILMKNLTFMNHFEYPRTFTAS